MHVEDYRHVLEPLLNEMNPAARFMIRAIMDDDRHCTDVLPDDYRQAMEFFRTALDLALEYQDHELAERVRRCRKRLVDPDVLLGGS